MYFIVYKDHVGEWRWRLNAKNHEPIAQGEGYVAKQDCLHAVELVKSTTANTPVHIG